MPAISNDRITVREIDTQAQFANQSNAIIDLSAASRQGAKQPSGRIEVVQWEDSESSSDPNSGSSSISLSKLMMGSTGGGKTQETKLTIDNLWKILACEKPDDAKRTPDACAQNRSRSRKDGEHSSRMHHIPFNGELEKGINSKTTAADGKHYIYAQSSKQESPMSDIFATPGPKSQAIDAERRASQMKSTDLASPFDRRNYAHAATNYKAQESKVENLFETPRGDGSTMRDRCSTNNATPHSFKMLNDGAGQQEGRMRESEFNFAANRALDQNLRYKSRINQVRSNAVDSSVGSPETSFALDSVRSVPITPFKFQEPKFTEQSMDVISNVTPQISKQSLSTSFSSKDLFCEEDSDEELESFKRKRGKRSQAANLRKAAPGLRKISRQVINTIRASDVALTYREVSDRVVARNYQAILEEVDQRATPDLTFESASCRGGARPGSDDSSELSDNQARAVENYRRRIYDVWSVLRAAHIIVQTDAKHFRYNHHVLESSARASANQVTPGVDTSRLSQIEEMLARFETVKKTGESSTERAARKATSEHEAIVKVVQDAEQQSKQTYRRIKERLAQLHELSRSNLALRRLIKRNEKRENKISAILDNSSVSSSDEIDNRDRRSAAICKLPFVVAMYQPDAPQRTAASQRTLSDRVQAQLGLVHNGKHLKVVSKKPIRCFDEQACLDYVQMSDDSEAEDEFEARPRSVNRRENRLVSRTFARQSTAASEKRATHMIEVDEEVLELLGRLPQKSRTGLRV